MRISLMKCTYLDVRNRLSLKCTVHCTYNMSPDISYSYLVEIPDSSSKRVPDLSDTSQQAFLRRSRAPPPFAGGTTLANEVFC